LWERPIKVNKGENEMPIVTVKTVEGLLTPEKKSELHQKLFNLLVEIEGGGNPKFARFVVVNLTEEPAENFSGGGIQLKPEMFGHK
jgi:4-oxalocrotonate tautomerase